MLPALRLLVSRCAKPKTCANSRMPLTSTVCSHRRASAAIDLRAAHASCGMEAAAALPTQEACGNCVLCGEECISDEHDLVTTVRPLRSHDSVLSLLMLAFGLRRHPRHSPLLPCSEALHLMCGSPSQLCSGKCGELLAHQDCAVNLFQRFSERESSARRESCENRVILKKFEGA